MILLFPSKSCHSLLFWHSRIPKFPASFRGNSAHQRATSTVVPSKVHPLKFFPSHLLPTDSLGGTVLSKQQQQKQQRVYRIKPTTETSTTHLAGQKGENVKNDERPMMILLASPFLDDRGDARSVVGGLLSLCIVGAVLGWLSPNNDALPTLWYRNVSSIIGYTYFLCWSVSFYPQVIQNYQRKSTDGLSLDFCLLNVFGFACYAAYNAALFWSPTIQSLYFEKYHTDHITVQSNDVAFAIHALILSSITLGQIFYYNRDQDNQERPSKVVVGILGVALILCLVIPIFIVTDLGEKLPTSTTTTTTSLTWLDYLYVLSSVKIFISLVKYIPQVWKNIQRQSTEGWSIWNILLDFTGGVLSDLQLLLDCYDMGQGLFGGISANPAKFMLGLQSISFDVVFMVQHYILYYDSDATEEWRQRESLLSASSLQDEEEQQEQH